MILSRGTLEVNVLERISFTPVLRDLSVVKFLPLGLSIHHRSRDILLIIPEWPSFG